MHLPALLKFSQQITKSYVAHLVQMEPCLSLAARTLARVCFSSYLHLSISYLIVENCPFFIRNVSFQVWNACKSSPDEHEQLNHEMDLLCGHENDVNYVQFSGCAVASRSFSSDSSHTSKEENNLKLRNSWSVFCLPLWFVFSFKMFLFISIRH